jgi:hypothetical protein
VAPNLKAAATAAGVTGKELDSINALSKAFAVHNQLTALPSAVAQEQYNKLPANQQQSLVQTFGNEDPTVTRQYNPIGTAFHYAGNVIGAAKKAVVFPFKVVGEASDLMTRAYRTAAISVDQGMGISDAWRTADDNGNKVFNPNRITNAKNEFGDDEVAVAMAVAAGTPLAKLTQGQTLTPSQQAYAASIVPSGVKKDEFQNILDAVNAAKYSPGRQVANLVTPKQLEGSGLFYRAISGAVDAAYRVFSDPTLAAGKVVKAVNAARYSLEIVLGTADKVKVFGMVPISTRNLDEVFAEPKVVNFWDNYGAELSKLRTAQKAGDTQAAVAARNNLKTIAPEFGPSVIDEMNKLSVPVSNAATAKAYFQNANQMDEILKGQPGRSRVLIPRLDASRKARIAALTTVNKVLNIDKVGSKLVEALYFGTVTNDGIVAKITTEAGRKEVVTELKQVKPKGMARLSTEQVQYRLDRFKQKFTYVPLFNDGFFDVLSKDASEKIYQLARTNMPQYYSKAVREAFDAADEGTRKEIFYGLWQTISDFRGLKVSTGGDNIVNQALGKNPGKYAADGERLLPNGMKEKYNPSQFGPDGESMAVIPSQLTSLVSAPSIADIDRLAARDGILKGVSNLAHADWVNKMTSYWSFLTLAGPRYAVRNATEDLMVHLAIGNSPWGLAKGRLLSTKVRTFAKYDADGNIIGRISADPLGVINRVVRGADRDRFTAQITAAKGDVTKIREIYATAVTESKLARAGITIGKEDAEILAEHIRFGNLDNALADVVEGGKNSFTGTDFATRALADQRRYGRSAELKVNLPKKLRKLKGAGYDNITPNAYDDTSLISWMMQVNFFANDKLGRIAVANLDNEAKALPLIKTWLTENPEVASRFRLYSPGVNGNIDIHAKAVFDSAKQLFTRNDEKLTLNTDFLNKVRVFDDTTQSYKVSGELNLSDLPTEAINMPPSILGPKLIPVSDSDNYTASLMSRGWDWMGEQNARFSREPMVFQEIVQVRKQMKETGFYDAYIAAHTKGITDPAKLLKAETIAKKKIAEIAEERAKMRVLSFVDNPLIQTQLAFNIRNFARFYRATEDFSRRVYKAVRYNPESIARASLTYEGIAHSGWIQEDDQGQKYFIYPGTATAYKAMQGMLIAFGIAPSFKTPMPVEFGAKLNMVTPSLNVDSIFPTFAGPLAGALVKTFENVMNVAFDEPAWVDTVVGASLGKYAVDQPMISALLPAHVNKVYALLNRDERDGQYASASRKAVTYLEASGHGIPQKFDENGVLIPPTAGELEDYRLKLKNATITVLALRAFSGLVLPASPQVALKSDMADWVRDNGSQSFKQVFNQMLADNNGDIDATTQRWIELFPKQIPYTITESDRKTVALVRYAEESGVFVDNNKGLFKQYPEGAAFLIPYQGDFSWDAYQTMSTMGLRPNKRVDEFTRDIQTAASLQTYYSNRSNYLESVKNAIDPYTKKDLRDRWQSWSTEWKATHPLIQEELAQGGEKAIKRQNALKDLSIMLDNPEIRNVRPKAYDSLKQMLGIYNGYIEQKAQFALLGSVGSQLQDSALASTISQLEDISKTNSNAKAAYDILFSRLLD